MVDFELILNEIETSRKVRGESKYVGAETEVDKNLVEQIKKTPIRPAVNKEEKIKSIEAVYKYGAYIYSRYNSFDSSKLFNILGITPKDPGWRLASYSYKYRRQIKENLENIEIPKSLEEALKLLLDVRQF